MEPAGYTTVWDRMKWPEGSKVTPASPAYPSGGSRGIIPTVGWITSSPWDVRGELEVDTVWVLSVQDCKKGKGWGEALGERRPVVEAKAAQDIGNGVMGWFPGIWHATGDWGICGG